MGVGAYISGFEVVDYHTENAATVIDEAIQAQNDKRLALLSLSYLSAATAHTISFMYAKDSTAGSGASRNTAASAAALGQADITVSVAPKDPAGNAAAASDIVAYQCSDGTWEFNTIQGVAGSVITFNSNLVKAVLAGGKVMIFGVVGDGASLKLKSTASVQKDWIAYAGPVLVHPYIGEPFYVTIDNATNAGFLQNALFAHIDK